MTPKKEINTLFSDVRTVLSQARNNAYNAVNSAMVHAYWEIGRLIVENEQKGKKRADYGEETLKNLSIQLSTEFGKGFSYPNLKNFRKFFLTYPEGGKGYTVRSLSENNKQTSNSIGYTLCSQLSWSHNRLIMRVENEKARLYYLKESLSNNWSVRELERNISTSYFERILSSKKTAGKATKKTEIESYIPSDFIKDPYVFEFLNIHQPLEFNEKEIETSLINHLEKLLMELGKGFSFVGRQFRISTETSHFYIDLVFYNYILKCFVLFDLKTEKLSHQDIGQMDMYVRLFDDLQKQENDNPTIGVILCTDKDETVVKYSVLKENRKLFATQYQMYLPTEKQLAEWIEKDRAIIEEKLNKKIKIRKSANTTGKPLKAKK